MKTIGLISGNNIHADKDGNFEITVNSSGPRDIKNHIHTSLGSKEFYIRDTIIDWENDRPNILEIENISKHKLNNKFDRKQQIKIVKEYMKKWATKYN